MFYYLCKRCNHMTKQKIEMKRHLEKVKQCEIKDKSNILTDNELYILSLEKYEMYMGLISFMEPYGNKLKEDILNPCPQEVRD